MPQKTSVAYFYILILFMAGATVFLSCQNHSKSNESKYGEVSSEGEKLMLQYCSSCHLPVKAKYLDKKTWVNHVLPAMARKVGIGVLNKNKYYITPSQTKSGTFIPIDKWQKIVAYFKRRAPKKIQIPDNTNSLKNDWALFSLQKPKWDTTHDIATTAMVAFDTLNHQIYSTDATNKTLYRWDEDLNPTSLRTLPSPAVDVEFIKESQGTERGVFTLIGTMRAVNSRKGKLQNMKLTKGKDPGKIIGNHIPRAVKSISGDFNKDGLKDWIVCGFGHNIGGLYEFEQQPDHHFKKKIIREVPGAIDVQTGDFNHDGWLDMMVLFAHAHEGIWMFTNNQKGGFNSKNLLKFLPVYGSTSFELDDFNHDGRPDILYTCGDNADYSKILKPFHGVYIFLNKGNGHFEQSYFFHINGSTKAIAADFDKDGDLDLSVISFFADLKHNAQSSFIYFEQTTPLHFKPHAIPVNQYGRWLSMDVGDFDGDHDQDIVLGNFSRGFLSQKKIQQEWDAYIPLIVLKNKTY